MKTDYDAILIAGPTASGKSAVALELAQKLGGAIVNADSMQVYQDLRVVTARPSEEEEAQAPHQLYGHVDATENYSAGRWGREVIAAIGEVRDHGLLPIIVGGTGLYFSALTEGLSPIPDVPEGVRQQVRKILSDGGVEAVRDALRDVDPVIADRLDANDRQRQCRALEVSLATGRPLSDWQNEPRVPLLRGSGAKIVLSPERDWLYDRCDRRFDVMMEEGALAEVEALLARDLDPGLPAMKALGVPELAHFLRGDFTLEEANLRAKMQTRRYAKRQMTWFRNQMISWNRVSEQQMARKIHEILSIIC